MYTLNATEIHAVAYAVDHAITTGGGSTAQGSCVYEEIMATLKASGVHAVAYGLVTKGNGDAFITEEKHMSLSTGGGKQVRDTPPAYTLKIRGGLQWTAKESQQAKDR